LSAAYSIRDARASDVDSIIAFTLREAREAEGLDLHQDAVRRGVSGAFQPQPLARYWIAEARGEPVGSISVVKEWSNFHGAYYWWIQSLFIVPEHRGSGLVQLLMDHVVRVAQETGALDVRLYAHASNARAVQAYGRCGFRTAPYVMMTRKLESPE
jgi:GNAT superfamily N-acetyltransferase